MMSEEARPSVQIRRAVPDDASLIASILYRSFAEYESAYTPEAFQATTPTPDQIRDRMSEGPAWVALEGDLIVGTVSAAPRVRRSRGDGSCPNSERERDRTPALGVR